MKEDADVLLLLLLEVDLGGALPGLAGLTVLGPLDVPGHLLAVRGVGAAIFGALVLAGHDISFFVWVVNT